LSEAFACLVASGAGKTTLTPAPDRVRRPVTRVLSVVHHAADAAWRADGRDYHFISTAKFEEMVQCGEFAEHAFVHQNRYGTAQPPIEAALARGNDVIFDVDWQGGAALAARWPADSLKIFILPPDLSVLEARLRQRATDAPEIVQRRLGKAKEELEHFTEYQHLIVNDDLDRAYTVLRAIYLTRRYGTADRPGAPYAGAISHGWSKSTRHLVRRLTPANWWAGSEATATP
jgi:guanylate kinase